LALCFFFTVSEYSYADLCQGSWSANFKLNSGATLNELVKGAQTIIDFFLNEDFACYKVTQPVLSILGKPKFFSDESRELSYCPIQINLKPLKLVFARFKIYDYSSEIVRIV